MLLLRMVAERWSASPLLPHGPHHKQRHEAGQAYTIQGVPEHWDLVGGAPTLCAPVRSRGFVEPRGVPLPAFKRGCSECGD